MGKMTALLALLLLFGVTETAAQRRGGGMGGGRGGGGGGFDGEKMREMRTKMEALRTCPVDMMWAALSFEIEMTEEQRVQVAATMKDAWRQRHDVFAFSQEHDAWNEGGKRMRDLKKKTDQRVKAVLEKDQWKAYEKALKKSQKAVRQEVPGF